MNLSKLKERIARFKAEYKSGRTSTGSLAKSIGENRNKIIGGAAAVGGSYTAQKIRQSTNKKKKNFTPVRRVLN